MPLNTLTHIRGLILDMDGVLWRGAQPLGNLPGIFDKMQAKGLRVILATNNATASAAQYLEKMLSYGVVLEPWQVINSSQATALYLSRRFPAGGAVYVIGEEGLVSTLSAAGFTVNPTGAQAVVVGMDRKLTYEKLRTATLLIRAGVPFIATNPDRTFPVPEGLVPGAGAIVAAVETATDVKPIVIGKPEPEMYLAALERLGTTPAETLVVGDRLETDIAGGQAIHCPTALVLSGVTSPEQAQAWMPAPELVLPDLTSLMNMF
jgi:4-nitrophenyl phosphatase